MNIKLHHFTGIIKDSVYYSGIFLSVFFPFCVIVASLSMILGHAFSMLMPVIAFFICLGLLLLDIPAKDRAGVLAGTLFFLVLFIAVSLYLGGLFFDASFDGQWYHEEGIIQLMRGWNPFAAGPPSGETDAAFFIARYPQGDLFALSSIFIFFKNSIEVAKALNFLMGICAFVLLVKALRFLIPSASRFQHALIILFAFITVLNPVAIAQWFTFYHDGRLYYEIIILASLIIIHHFRAGILTKAAVISNIIFIINIKFTGIEYAGLLCGTYILFVLISKQWKKGLRFASLSLVVAILSLAVIGYGSYVKNMIYCGHPLYPIMGKGNISDAIVACLEPKNFTPMNNIQKMYFSNTAFPVWSRNPENSHQRGLFSLCDVSYYKSYYRPDTEMNGFGIFYAEMVVLSFCTLIFSFFAGKNNNRWIYLWLIYGVVLLSGFINPLGFIARYAPEQWLLPLIPILGLLFMNKIYARIIAFMLLLLLGTNTVYLYSAEIQSIEDRNRDISEQLLLLEKQNKPILFRGKWSSFTERLSEHNIKFLQVKRLPGADSIPLKQSFNLAYIEEVK